MAPPLRVLFDAEGFLRHRRSGITRYFAELVDAYRADPALGVEAVTPYRYVANDHLTAARPGEYRQLPLPRQLRLPVFDRLNRRRMRACGPVDVVHHSLYEPRALDLYDARRRVTTVYDFTFEKQPDVFGDNPVVKRSLADKQEFFARCDALTAISQTTYDDLRLLMPEFDKPVFVTPLGAGDEFFDPRPTAIKGLPDRYLLHVGNRFEHKNVDLLFRAFAEVARRYPELHLVMTGQAPPTEPARLRELGIEQRTVCLSASDAQLPWLYRKAEAFVFPSRYEGFGLPVVEAMAAGCPVLVADTPALLEVADEAGLVFGVDDVDGLVEQLDRLLVDDGLASRLRSSGRSRALDYTWARTASATLAAYDAAVRS